MELYLDNSATSIPKKEVLDLYFNLLSNNFASTGSLHNLGVSSLMKESEALFKIANLLNVKPSEIYFNSGATEGNNYATKGVALNYKNRGKTIITSKVEHPSILECFKQLEKDYGFKAIYLDVDENGVIDINNLEKLLNDDVILVSIMYVNHEVGAINPIKEIRKLLKKYPKIIFHSDITQAIGKIKIDLNDVDLASMSFHKIHGLKGSGFMYIKDGIKLYPLISGLSPKNTLRAGTSNWQVNVANSKALELTLLDLNKNYENLKLCQEKLIKELEKIEGIVLNTNSNVTIPEIVNFSALNYNPEVLIRALSNKGIYVSSRSVCSTAKKDHASSTLLAMNKDMDDCISSIRVSYDAPLNDEQISYFIKSLKEVLKEVKK